MIIDKNYAKKIYSDLKKSIFIYPTDSIYGIGCDATNSDLISKLRLIKNRNEKPFSIIAPSKEWVKENFILTELENNLVERYGDWIDVDGEKKPFTFLLKPKNNDLLPENLTFGLPKVGVRIPKHWISEVVTLMGYPIVTTSVNESGIIHMTSLNDLDENIRKEVDYIIEEGVLKGNPSTIITIEENKLVYLKR